MRSEGSHALLRIALFALAAAGLTAGCTPMAERDDIAVRPAPPPVVTADPAVALLTYAAGLRQASPAARAGAVAAARRAVDAHPGARNYAHMAVAFGTPDQRRYAPDEAARYARKAISAADAAWSPAAEQYLRDYARLYGALTRVRAAAESSGDHGADASEPTAAGTDDDPQRRIRELRRALGEAQRKLHELAAIEERLGEDKP